MQDGKLVPGRSERPPTGVAVDFGGTKIAAARIERGHVVARRQIETVGDASITEQISMIARLLDDVGLSIADRLGVALTGRVNQKGEWFAVNRQTLTQVDTVPIRELLAEHLGRDLMVFNDAVAGAIGEYCFGAGTGTTSMAFLTISTGIGGGLVLNGRPVVSAHGLAGHVGFTTSRMASGDCGSGRRATVESIASGVAIARSAKALGHGEIDAREVFEHHRADQAWATELIETSAMVIAELCANLRAALEIERIVLGGGVGLAPGYAGMVRRFLDGEPQLFRPELRTAALGQDAALLGVLAGIDP